MHHVNYRDGPDTVCQDSLRWPDNMCHSIKVVPAATYTPCEAVFHTSKVLVSKLGPGGLAMMSHEHAPEHKLKSTTGMIQSWCHRIPHSKEPFKFTVALAPPQQAC
jgi:hypothetical protein